MAKSDANPMDRASAAPGAWRQPSGRVNPAAPPAVTSWSVCRVHGAYGDAPPDPAHPNWRSRNAIELRPQINELVKKCRDRLFNPE